jgi:hypothetical protein
LPGEGQAEAYEEEAEASLFLLWGREREGEGGVLGARSAAAVQRMDGPSLV